MNAPPKLLAISSPGGHWIQLTRLCERLEDRYSIIYAMPNTLFNSAATLGGRKVYSITDVSADDKWRLIPCTLQVLYILLKERPQAILSTGAAPGAVAVWLGKLLRIRTIWVDSIANVRQISRAGRLAQKQADVFLTQWEHLSDGQSVLFKGAVL
ncbi:MAG: oligosaccharide biosynthesis protein Alg14 [Thiothrix sp.]|uniref:oligosaccharide biosynthesis protein Alg14 n=1 Tax=Thiothrix sp. TaxID=1032 RepID=UPI00262F65C6|nr:oligosaccharide biosynthesis protein Alg14 [Thiothrix sp.]MDD5392003.1 oligosaccharide biosynthesis protein Alg14 [Thiothrix sp.]